jgi:hypothetical protein
MTIHLRPEQEKIVRQAIRFGAHRHPDEVITRALEILRSEEAWLRKQRTVIREKIERAFAQTERGEIFTAEESAADMQRRKAAWLLTHKP